MTFGATRTRTIGASNVVALNVPQHRQPLTRRLAAHATAFATGRRSTGDVFWLKENAEFLNILECTGQSAAAILDAYDPVHARIGEIMGEFPQYYQFHLSICLDLEALGMPGNKAEALCHWAVAQGLAEAELSDLQRAEARRLLARRDLHLPDEGLTARLHRFARRSRTFAIPNRKAAYELTHIVFYLSDYGRRDPGLDESAMRSLIHAGLLAFLDQDLDILAEVCIALRYAGETPSPVWDSAVTDALSQAEARERGYWSEADDYHAYLVSSWLAGVRRRKVMPLTLTPDAPLIAMPAPPARPLREMSQAISQLRNHDWHAVRGRVTARMDRPALEVLQAAEASTESFESFYEIFSRAARPDV